MLTLLAPHRLLRSLALAMLGTWSLLPTSAATFSGNARLEVPDNTGGLSWNVAGQGLTVSCWLRVSIPTDATIAESMTVLANNRSGTEADPHAYLIRLNTAGQLEFSSKAGASAAFVRTLIAQPYLDRWYHISVTRDMSGNFVGYVDGRKVFEGNAPIETSLNGLSIGGWNASASQGRCFRGDIQEVAILQQVLTPVQIRAFMFADLPVTNLSATLKGYFRLAYSSGPDNWYRNSALSPPTGATNGVPFGSIVFEPLDIAGEQSAFDARRNGGLDSIIPLSGAFTWEQVALARPTPGIAFDLRFSYCSANASPSVKLGESLSPKWQFSERRVRGGAREVR